MSPFQCISPWEGCRGGNGRGTRGWGDPFPWWEGSPRFCSRARRTSRRGRRAGRVIVRPHCLLTNTPWPWPTPAEAARARGGFPTLGTEWRGRSEAEVCTREARKISVPLARARSGASQEGLVSLLGAERMRFQTSSDPIGYSPLRRVCAAPLSVSLLHLPGSERKADRRFHLLCRTSAR
jgi:hypothetical protein